MLSYRHAFHAGSPADVLKHAVLTFILAYAVQKPRPLYVLDTHAGAGAYDLGSAYAQKTGEARLGIARLAGADEAVPELFADYLDIVRNRPAYPGSPILAHAFLRRQDRLELAELHPTDHAILAQGFDGVPRVRVTREDGLLLLLDRMPPPERRAIALIDPSYEVKSDYEAVVETLAAAHRRFATGTYLVWYPVIERERATAFLDGLRATGIPAQYRIELGLLPDAPGRGMTGSGLVVVNPPYTLPEAVQAALPWLAGRLGASGPVLAEWLVPEQR